MREKSRIPESEHREGKRLPDSVDQPGTLFSYGSNIDVDMLRENLKNTRGEDSEVVIKEAANLEEYTRLSSQEPPETVIILRDVKMDGVKVNIATQDQITDALDKLVEHRKTVDRSKMPSGEADQFLIVRDAVPGEKSRFVNGGLTRLMPEDLTHLDKYEDIDPDSGIGVYERRIAPELEIDGVKYKPTSIEYYSGTVGDIHEFLDPEKKGKLSRRKTAKSLREGWDKEGGRKGQWPKTSKWPHDPDGHSVR